jgi:preprotein translocase subunit SecA
MHGRRYSEGLHQAIEAKENVSIRQESMTLATITFQNYFRLYYKLAGMTGTAATEADEFGKIYRLEVTSIPTHRPMVRTDNPDRIYKTEAGKFRAVAADVKERHLLGQPVLLGTVSIAKNEQLSQVLEKAGIPHRVLNAKNNEAEAEIIAGAGKKGAVTLATNIAGRGTDIVLEAGVAELGGLHVVGTERHESRRIDNQLRGRSGRQGDPGSSQFYVSLEDDLMRIFGSDRIAGIMTSLGIDDDTPIENAMVSRSLESAQKKVEGHNFDIRKQLVEYDDVMNKHREAIYARRRRALNSLDLRPEITGMIEAEIKAMVKAHTDSRTGELDALELLKSVHTIMHFTPDIRSKVESSHPDDVAEILIGHAHKLYDERIKQFGDPNMKLMERLTYLRVLDNLWIEHLEAMQSLREGIGLRAIGQRDPLVEYKAEGYRLYQQFISAMEAEIAATIFKVQISVQGQAPEPEPVETALTRAAAKSVEAGSAVSGDGPRATGKDQAKVGRNDPCPCGSGKKFKRCGMIDAPEHHKRLAGA